MLPTDIVSYVPKPVLMASYAIVATTLCLTPVLAAAARLGQRKAWLGQRVRHAILCITFAALFAGCFWFGHGADDVSLSILMLAVALLFSWSNGNLDRVVFAVTFTTLFTSRMLIWWRQAEGPLFTTGWEIAEIALMLVLVTAVLDDSMPFRASFKEAAQKKRMLVRAALVVLFLLLAAAMSFARQLEAGPVNAYGAWHHWGVYIAPVQLLRAGAVPFKDFALQYGLGPTLLINLLAPQDPWSIMPALTSCALLLQIALIAALVCVIVDMRRSGWYFALALLACGGASLTWLAWPPELAIAAQAASVSGMRYAPVLIQALFILLVGERIRLLRFQIAGHVIWALASLWAPELFFYATAVWGPYFLWQKSTAAGRFQLGRAVLALLSLALVVVITVALFLALFWYRFATLPSWYGYIAYIVNEPDPINLAVRGVVWLLVSLLILIGASLFEAVRCRPRDAGTRNLFVTLCLFLATLSIFIGRSHENNFLVVLPFLLPVVLCAAMTAQPLWLKRALYAFFACSLAYWPLFNWNPWLAFMHFASEQGLAAAYDSKLVTDELSYMTPEGQRILAVHRPERLASKVDPNDAARAIAAIASQYGEPITIYDINSVMLTGPESRGWNAIQDTAAFLPLSPTKRLAFVAATAQRLRQPGWFLVNRLWDDNWDRNRRLLDDMDSAYVEDKHLEFGTYHAIRFVPKVLSNAPSAPSAPSLPAAN